MRVLNKRDRVPPDAVYVGRPTKWGNPFVIGQDGTREEVVAKYRRWLTDEDWVVTEDGPGWGYVNGLMHNIEELRGKDLVCWCAPQACHADVLLELANE